MGNRPTLKELLLVFAGYALLVVIMTWPVVAHLGTNLVGGDVDQWTHFWTFHWVRDQLLNGRNPLYSYQIFYPVGVSLATHNIAWINILLWLPLQAVLGEIAAYNVLFLGIFAFNGFALYLLARDLTGSKVAAFIGGLVFAFWPYTLSHHDHPNMIFVAWVPLALLYLRRALLQGTKRDVGFTILFITLTGWTRLHLLIIGSLLIGLYALYLLATNFCRENVWRLVTIALLSALFVLPAAIPIITNQLTSETPEDIFLDEQETHQSDLLTYFIPSYYHPLWGKGVLAAVKDIYLDPYIPRSPFLGYTAVFLAISALALRRRQSWFWAVTAVLYILIALGPQLRFNGELYPGLPMPYRLIEDIYFVRVLRQPSRFNILLGLPMAMLVAQGCTLWLQRLSNQRRQLQTAVAIALLILAEYAVVPYPYIHYTTPEWFNTLAAEPDDFAILNLPIQLFSADKRHMFDQVTHGKAIVNGKVARVPREALAFLNSTPFLQGLQQGQVNFEGTAVTRQLRPLADANVRYLVLHKDLLSPDTVAAWQQWLPFPPIHDDDALLVYQTRPKVGQDLELAYPLTAELGLIQAQVLTTQTAPRGLVQVRALWGSTAVPTTDYDLCWQLRRSAQEVAQSDCVPLAERPTSQWLADEMVRGEYAFTVAPSLAPGTYEVALTLGQSGEIVTPPAAVGTVDVQAVAWPVTWDDLILLTDYTVQPTRDTVELTFYWQALQPIDTSYKIFLHLRDVVTGEVVAQTDTFPVGWTYLTDQWAVGEVVEDHISLPVADVPPGSYQLFVGFYEEDSGERLPTTFADNSVPLSGYGR